jgi:predicted dehydrogenase
LISRILIVGLGSIGERHLALARSLFPSAEIKVFRHKPLSPAPEISDGCIFSLEEVHGFSPQIAVIANPAPFHIQIAKALAEAGAHLLIEKPLSDSTEGVISLIEVCRRKNLTLEVGYNLRFSPSLRFFRELLDQQLIGKTLSVRCEVGQYLPTWRQGSSYRQGVSAKKELGGGVLMELSHELDYLRWFFGDIDWVRATLSRQSSLDIDVEDFAQLTLGFSPINRSESIIGTVNLDFFRHDKTRLFTIIGERGSLRWDGIAGEVLLFVEGGSGWRQLFVHQPQFNETYLAEWKEFLKCINNNGIPTITGEDGLRVLEIIEAARVSAISGTQVSVNRMQLKDLT